MSRASSSLRAAAHFIAKSVGALACEMVTWAQRAPRIDPRAFGDEPLGGMVEPVVRERELGRDPRDGTPHHLCVGEPRIDILRARPCLMNEAHDGSSDEEHVSVLIHRR